MTLSPIRLDPQILQVRQMGVLLHPSSLPGPFGVGDIGPEARRFVDWLAEARVRIWQILPLSPPGGPLSDVPYASWAALAGNPQLISLEDLVSDGVLEPSDLPGRRFEEGWAFLEQAIPLKSALVARAAGRLWDARHPLRATFERFVDENEWAREAARFSARRRTSGNAPWWTWSAEFRSRSPALLRKVDGRLEKEIRLELAALFFFERQWRALRDYASARGVRMFGDLPIYVETDSADVWAHPSGYQIRSDGSRLASSGTPPDIFSDDGQYWGGPLYDWKAMAQDDYAWWRSRLLRAFEHSDAVRIDHFRAFAAYWSVPEGARTSKEGQWVKGPGLDFFKTIERYLGPLPLAAEDLGYIDDDVIQLLRDTGFPGMKILHYAFGENAENPYLPHNVDANSLMYPGNHDNDTTVGWWNKAPHHVRSHAQHYLGRHGDDIAWDLNRLALASASRLAVIQMQDLLSLDTWARMNDPTSYVGPVETWRNWRWRLRPGEASGEVAGRLRFLGELYRRC